MAATIDYIADALGIDLPELYSEFLVSLMQSKKVQSVLGDAVVTSPERVVELNTNLWCGGPIAGLDEWPEDYLVIGEDGCGDYFLIDGGDSNEPVLFYDHEADVIYRIADSLNDFANRMINGDSLDDIVLHSGYETRRQKALVGPAEPTQIIFGDDAPAWSQDWMEFVRTFLGIATYAQTESELTLALNREFGSRPVCWVGQLTKVDLGKYKSASIEMPACDHIRGAKSCSGIGSLSVGLRTEEEDYDHVLHPCEIRTSVRSWQAASVGDTIRFLMMIAPGQGDQIPCIRVRSGTRSRRPWITINDCGAHLLEVVRRAS